jgi:hypothetical protein
MGRPMAADAPATKSETPYWKRIFVSATHCGCGCVIGDILGPPIVFGFGLTLLGVVLFAEYVVEFVFAYVFGIAFQYFPIRWDPQAYSRQLGLQLKNALPEIAHLAVTVLQSVIF